MKNLKIYHFQVKTHIYDEYDAVIVVAPDRKTAIKLSKETIGNQEAKATLLGMAHPKFKKPKVVFEHFYPA